jgi:cardiolipin synthase A/B
MERSLIERMKSAGVDVQIFRPVHWYTLDRVNNRTHRKVLVVDGRIGFTGGVGIADEWNGNARSPSEWRDNHYRVEGPVVAGLQSSFVENWLEVTNELLIGEDYFPPLKAAGKLAAQTVKSSPFSGSENVHLMLLMAIAAATDHIRIEMAYFVPSEVAIQQLIEARKRGVEVEVLVPGDHVDNAGARSASRYLWGELLEAGVRIYEFEPTMLHVKFVTVDDVWATVGSANFDERSFGLNDEANLTVFDQGFTQTHIDIFEADKRRAREVTFEDWQNRPLQQKAIDLIWSALGSQM